MRKAVKLLFDTSLLMFLLVLLTPGCSHRSHDQGDNLLSRASNLLDEISHNARNAIPAAVLNDSKCVVAIPLLHGGEQVSAAGVANCREAQEQWGQPFLVTFVGHSPKANAPNLVVLVLRETGARKLQSAKLAVGQRAPGPLETTTPVTTQIDLHAECFGYQDAADTLGTSAARGTVARAAADHRPWSKKSVEKFLSSEISFFNSIMPNGIVIHHTAVLPMNHSLPRNEKDVDAFHQARGFEITCQGHVYHIAYHYLILPDGKVQPGRPERCQGAHAVGYNSYLGISVVGDFSAKDSATNAGPRMPTKQQLEALIRLCRQLRDRYNIPLQHIVRHSDISSTDCPGNRFPFQYVLQKIEQRDAAQPRT